MTPVDVRNLSDLVAKLRSGAITHLKGDSDGFMTRASEYRKLTPKELEWFQTRPVVSVASELALVRYPSGRESRFVWGSAKEWRFNGHKGYQLIDTDGPFTPDNTQCYSFYFQKESE